MAGKACFADTAVMLSALLRWSHALTTCRSDLPRYVLEFRRSHMRAKGSICCELEHALAACLLASPCLEQLAMPLNLAVKPTCEPPSDTLRPALRAPFAPSRSALNMTTLVCAAGPCTAPAPPKLPARSASPPNPTPSPSPPTPAATKPPFSHLLCRARRLSAAAAAAEPRCLAAPSHARAITILPLPRLRSRSQCEQPQHQRASTDGASTTTAPAAATATVTTAHEHQHP